jgi:hypothetical protein
MKSATLFGLIAVAALAYFLFHRSSPHPPVADDPPPPAATPPTKILHATRLATKEERRQLADQISTAQAARTAGAAPGGAAAIHGREAPPRLPTTTLDPEHPDEMKTTIRSAMREAIPLLTDCYAAAIPNLTDDETRIAAKLTLTSDPDIGTVIDAHQIADDQGRPLLASFDDCLRTTFQQLALPPIENGGTLEVTYPFVFHK